MRQCHGARAVCLATLLLMGQAAVADRAQTSEIAESKAQALEQDAVVEGGEAPASPSEAITRGEVQAVDPSGEEPLDDAITCLARSIYWEARGEGVADMEAVANVVMNRLGHEGFPDTVCGVVMQGSEQGACQFSWWCDGRPDEAEKEEPYAMAKEIARKALNRQLEDRTGGALYFHHGQVSPSWGSEYIKTMEVGKFLFYKPRDGMAR